VTIVTTKETHTHLHNSLDVILLNCLRHLAGAQRADSDHWGLVSAAVVGPDNQIAYGVNHLINDKLRMHAEAVAIHRYINDYGDISPECVIITTLSPCSEAMHDRAGVSCTELINQLDIKRVYCGYKDPTQHAHTAEFNVVETKNLEIRQLCKKIANTFLKSI